MSEPTRQHPVAALAKVVDIIRQNFLTILIVVVAGGTSDEAIWNLVGLGGVAVVLLVWGVLDWLRFTYRVEEGELRIHQGVFVRKKLYLTPERIQVINITSGLVQRMFGLVAVEVKTAGASSKEARISALHREQAEQLEHMLRKKAAPASEGEGVREDYFPGSDRATEESGTRSDIYELGLRDLVVAASTSGSFGVALSIVGGFFSQIDQLVSEEQMMAWAERFTPNMPSTNLVILGVAAVIAISWLLAFLGTIIKYYGFQVEVKEEELVIVHGLIEKKQLTIPYNRIQALSMREELLRQPFGYVSLHLESAGYGDQGSNTATLYPLLPREDARDFIRRVVPEFDADLSGGREGPPRRAMRRYLLRMTWLGLGFALPFWFFVPYGGWALLALPLAWLLGWAQYRAAGIGVRDGSLVICRRVLSKTTAVVKRYRVQAAELKQNPFQRRLHLLSCQVTVASGSQGQSFSVRELDRETAHRYWLWCSSATKTIKSSKSESLKVGKSEVGKSEVGG
ncbi:MAG: PH domain-containing protein [Balneolaceae bacterium]|nr:PH domain-containing protein [Balneolaceae bacterium]